MQTLLLITLCICLKEKFEIRGNTYICFFQVGRELKYHSHVCMINMKLELFVSMAHHSKTPIVQKNVSLDRQTVVSNADSDCSEGLLLWNNTPPPCSCYSGPVRGTESALVLSLIGHRSVFRSLWPLTTWFFKWFFRCRQISNVQGDNVFSKQWPFWAKCFVGLTKVLSIQSYTFSHNWGFRIEGGRKTVACYARAGKQISLAKR